MKLALGSCIVLALAIFGATTGCKPEGRVEETAPVASPVVMASKTGEYGRASEAELAKLTPTQLDVTQHAATEPPYRNAYWNNHAVGLYVDVVSGEPLFSSRDKFESGTGWPSFTRPVEEKRVVNITDSTLG